MYPWHPMFTHVPIAFLAASVILDHCAQRRQRPEFAHLGRISPFAGLFTGLLTKGPPPRAHSAIGVIMLILIVLTGFMGGQLAHG